MTLEASFTIVIFFIKQLNQLTMDQSHLTVKGQDTVFGAKPINNSTVVVGGTLC
jgi:hypothetical protein